MTRTADQILEEFPRTEIRKIELELEWARASREEKSKLPPGQFQLYLMHLGIWPSGWLRRKRLLEARQSPA
ncbi:MAG: hypothetical protein AAF514_08810 [Verrucomicrobiota bacterium]